MRFQFMMCVCVHACVHVCAIRAATQRHRPHGVKLHLCNKVRRDLRIFHIDEAEWYVLVQDRQEWHRVYKGDLSVINTAHDGSTVLVDPRIKPDTVVTVLGHVVQWAP